MKKILIVLSACALLSSCGTTTESLYYWGGYASDDATSYEDCAYRNYRKQTPESICNLVIVLDNMVNHPAGTRQVPPPGICAEYGYLLLQPETATAFASSATDSQKSHFDGSDYTSLFRQKGEEMMSKEVELYPESAVFIAPLVKKFTE